MTNIILIKIYMVFFKPFTFYNDVVGFGNYLFSWIFKPIEQDIPNIYLLPRKLSILSLSVCFHCSSDILCAHSGIEFWGRAKLAISDIT